MAKNAPKKRQFSDIKYKTYDTSEGHGSVAEWRSHWESMTGEQATKIINGQSQSPLAILGFDFKPTEEVLTKRYRQLMQQHHPDKGGDEATAKKIIAAYTILLESLQKKT